jgi:hypothetical protein
MTNTGRLIALILDWATKLAQVNLLRKHWDATT